MHDTKYNCPQNGKYNKQKHKSGQAAHNVFHFHVASVSDALADFYCKCHNDHHCKYINPRNDQYMMFAEGLKLRINNQQQCHADDTDHNKMQLLIRQNVLA